MRRLNGVLFRLIAITGNMSSLIAKPETSSGEIRPIWKTRTPRASTCVRQVLKETRESGHCAWTGYLISR